MNGHKLDKFHDLCVGRLLANDAEQISNYTKKLFRYELNPGNGEFDYLKRILYSEGLDWQQNSCQKYLNSIYKSLFNANSNLRESDVQKYPSGAEIVDTINCTKFGYISLLNHAGPSGVITYGKRENSSSDSVKFYLWAIDTVRLVYGNYPYNLDWHSNNGINNIGNSWHPNICYSIGCSTMPFDKAPGYENVNCNFGEAFTTTKDSGGPGFLGYTREGSIGQSVELERIFAKQLKTGYFKIGEAEAISKEMYSSSPYLNIAHNLLGDPEFEIWSDTPQLYLNIDVIRFNDSIKIEGINVDSTIVAYSDTINKVKQKLVRTSSITLNDASPNSPIMLYKHNYIPYIAPLLLQNESFDTSKYIIAGDVVAGNTVDSNRTSSGDVVIKEDIEYEIESSGTVTLQDGFKVEKGAIFAVYPSCF